MLEALDARCARAALEARSESPWDRLRAMLREASGTPVGVVVGARNLWGDAPAGARRGAPLRARARSTRGVSPRSARPTRSTTRRRLGPVAPGVRGGRRRVRPDADRRAGARHRGRALDRGGASRSPRCPGATEPLRVRRRRPHRARRRWRRWWRQVAAATRPPRSRCRCRRRAGLAPLSADRGGRRRGRGGAGRPPARWRWCRPARRPRRCAPRWSAAAAPSTARPRRSTAPPAWWARCSPPTACARPRPPCSAPPSPCRRPSSPASSRASAGWACRAASSRSPPSRRPWPATWRRHARVPARARRSWRRPPATSSTAAAGPRSSPSSSQIALGRAGRLRGPVADRGARGGAAADDPASPRARPRRRRRGGAAGPLRGGPGAVGDVRRGHRAGGGAAALAGRRGREPAGPAGDRPRPARHAGGRRRGLRRRPR